uniref:Enoyl-CoA hydratase n=1 Tax=Aplanochytrium stocchinoi TaxID=215587 RepID=A0A7S3V1M2_9STRA
MSLVSYERKDDVVVLTMDDSKMNSFSFEMIDQINKALDKAEKEQGSWSLLIVGNNKAFSAGFDLKTMTKPPCLEQHELFMQGGSLVMRLFEFPRPVIFGCSGHALALGAIMLMAGDFIVGKRGKGKIGINEVAIGMTVPVFGVELARLRLSRKHFAKAVLQGSIYSPDEAVECGFLDIAVDENEFQSTCMAEATRLAKLKNPGFSNTKSFIKQETWRKIHATIHEDGKRLLPREAKL